MPNIKLDNELEQRIELIRKKKGISKYELVKKALILYIQNEYAKLSAYDLGEEFFDSVQNGVKKSISNYKSSVKKKLKEKFSSQKI